MESKGRPLSMDAHSKTAVLLDPYPLWLDAVSHVLSRIGIEVLGTTTSPSEALELAEELSPDMLIVELSARDTELDGVGLLRRACTRFPELKVVVFSAYDDGQHVDAALDAGATAYVIKTADPEDFASAIRQSFEHSIYFAGARVGAMASLEIAVDDSPGLTSRETEILKLVAEGHTNAQLAKMLWVTEQTVKFHLSNVYRKLDVANRTEASRWAQMHGLLPVAAASADAAA
jgi:DNA-binding NarL/FixJ family response regulator